jgi:hypothetical protein
METKKLKQIGAALLALALAACNRVAEPQPSQTTTTSAEAPPSNDDRVGTTETTGATMSRGDVDVPAGPPNTSEPFGLGGASRGIMMRDPVSGGIDPGMSQAPATNPAAAPAAPAFAESAVDAKRDTKPGVQPKTPAKAKAKARAKPADKAPTTTGSATVPDAAPLQMKR